MRAVQAFCFHIGGPLLLLMGVLCSCPRQRGSSFRNLSVLVLQCAAHRREPIPLSFVHYVEQAHDVNPGSELDFDWTIAPGNKAKEFALREIRNKLIKSQFAIAAASSAPPPRRRRGRLPVASGRGLLPWRLSAGASQSG